MSNRITSGPAVLRVGVYARYSSDQQNGQSIEDQIRLCKERIERESWQLEQVYRDAAISGASVLRPGYQAMLEAVRDGGLDVVLAEALDRLSRDQEDVAGLFKRLKFAGVRLVTLAEGEISELHIGLKGTMNALFLKDLAEKTRRGLRGRVAAGKSAGGISYGYRVVRAINADGEPIRGERAIDEAEAIIVRRIFQMFADGSSPLAIAKQLNKEGISGPGERAWRDTTIRGHAERATGILRNELYIGRLIWNRMRFLKDPTTGKRISRMNDRSLWVTEEVAHLAVVNRPLWDQVQDRLGVLRETSGANDLDRPRYWDRRRAQHLLTGKTFCGTCGGPMANVGRDYIACSSARKQAICTSNRSIRRSELETLILDALRKDLMAPNLVAEFVSEFTVTWNRLAATASAGRDGLARDLTVIERKLNGLINAIADGLRAPGLQVQLDELTRRQSELKATLKAPTPATPRLHPNLAEVYRTKVQALHDSIYANPSGKAALESARALIDRVELTPVPKGSGFSIELIGELAAMLRLGMGFTTACATDDQDLFRSSVKVVAGARFERAAFRL